MEKNYSKVEIRQKKEGTPFTEVFIDGHKIRGVRGYKLEHSSAGSVPTLTIDLNALDVSVENELLLLNPAYGEFKIVRVEKPDELLEKEKKDEEN